jgi:hypothetical protein
VEGNDNLHGKQTQRWVYFVSAGEMLLIREEIFNGKVHFLRFMNAY